MTCAPVLIWLDDYTRTCVSSERKLHPDFNFSALVRRLVREHFVGRKYQTPEDIFRQRRAELASQIEELQQQMRVSELQEQDAINAAAAQRSRNDREIQSVCSELVKNKLLVTEVRKGRTEEVLPVLEGIVNTRLSPIGIEITAEALYKMAFKDILSQPAKEEADLIFSAQEKKQ